MTYNYSDEHKENFREANRASRKAVRIAKAAVYEDLYANLDSREGINMVYKLANTRDRRYISDMPFINRYCKEHDAAVVRACLGIAFPLPEGKDYSLAPIIRDLLC